MTQLKCGSCGTDLLPATSFCRQCGAAITDGQSIESSEQPTAILGNTESATTQRLHPRATGPAITSGQRPSSRRNLVIGAAIVLLIIGVISAVAIVRLRRHTEAPRTSQLTYPGASTIVDITNTDGSRTVQLHTSDPLDKVESWYHKSLTLTKAMRLTSTSYIMKNDKVTIILASEDNKTNILIKQVP